MCAACVVDGHRGVMLLEAARCCAIRAPAADDVSVCGKRKICSINGVLPSSQTAGCVPRKIARLTSTRSSSTDGSCSELSACCLVHGVKAVKGGRPYMEDAYSVQTNLTQVTDVAGDKCGQLNFYSVFDGHGGDYVAQHCSEFLHKHFKTAMSNNSEDQVGSESQIDSALMTAFERTDDDLRKSGKAALVGSTAVVVLVTEENYWIANCGDSRALLCRDGVTVSLTEDHKPEREDERMRIMESGGFVVCRNGVVRVMGALSVSRAIGDHVLQRYGVSSKPDTYSMARQAADEFLILASDGLFSVLSNEEATTLARRSLIRARRRGASRDAAARIAANVLTKVALHRGAQDNVTVVVVDLMSALPDSSDEQEYEHGSA